ISGVSAGKYIVGLFLELFPSLDQATRAGIMNWGAVAIACAVCMWFYRANLKGMHESSTWALRIMKITTAVAVGLLLGSVVTLFAPRPDNQAPVQWSNLQKPPDLAPKETATPAPWEPPGSKADPLGFLRYLPDEITQQLRTPGNWFQWFGLAGLLI